MNISFKAPTVSRRGFLASAFAFAAAGAIGSPSFAASGGRLRAAMASFGSEQMDPASETRHAVFEIWLMVYENLIEIGEDNALVPGLAESWSVDSTGLIWTFVLRKGVQFHKGWGEMTADDAVFSLERWMNPKAVASSRPMLMATIDKVVKTGDYSFEIHTKSVAASLPYLLSPHEATTGLVFSKKYLLEEGGEAFEDQNALLNKEPIGTGPYQLVERRRGESLLFEAVADHWRAKPEMKEVELLLVPDASTQTAMLQSGDVDLISIDFDRAATLQGDPNIAIHEFKNSIDFGLLFYATYGTPATGTPLADVRVRQALSKSIDRQTIIDALLGGNANLPSVPWGISPSGDGINPEDFKDWADDLATYDLDGAKALLAEAGYPDGFEGARLYLTHFPGSLSNAQQVVLAMSQMWSKIGIKVNIELMDYPNLRPRMIGDPNSDLIAPSIVPFSSAPRFTPTTWLAIWYRFQALDANKTQFTNDPELIAQVEETINLLSSELDAELRRNAIVKMMSTLNDQWLSVPVLTSSVLIAVNAQSIKGMVTRSVWPSLGRVYDTVTSA